MRKHNFAFIDIEATGLNIIKHEILEIGGVISTPALEIIEEFEIKIKPEHIENADPVSLKINHYDPVQWTEAKSLEEAMKIFSAKVKDCIMVGQNVAFDSAYLEYAFRKTGIANTMHYHKLDTFSIAWAKLRDNKDIEKFSLRDLGKYFGIENKNAHNALSDARATFELYKKLMEL
jgi:DNA polymerase III epsilon subunit-like protein